MDRAHDSAVIAEAGRVLGKDGTLGAVMEHMCAFCDGLLPDPRWSRMAQFDWAADYDLSREWLSSLLTGSEPGPEITGFWFGLFMPVRDGVSTWDFYVSGSTWWTEDDADDDWPCDATWWVDGRYRRSAAQEHLKRHAEKDTETSDAVSWISDCYLRQVHVLATVLGLLRDLPPSLWLGQAPIRCVAAGHDAGGSLEIAVIGPSGPRPLDFVFS